MSWIDDVKTITQSDRQRDYGHPLQNFIRIAVFWSVQMGVYVSPVKVAEMMIGVKLAREVNTSKEDNWIDTMGYATCVDRMSERLREMGVADDYNALENPALDIDMETVPPKFREMGEKLGVMFALMAYSDWLDKN